MHAASMNEIRAEPNLVPLLDLVFQLIMFFMVCVNFVSQQVNEDIKLPVAQSARPMDKTEVDVLFLNLDLLASSQNSPEIGRHRRQPNRIEFFNPLQIRFADAMPAVQDLSVWRKDDGIT